ncbi:MAG: glycoside hydrolase family 18 protein [Nitrospirota bacterium]
MIFRKYLLRAVMVIIFIAAIAILYSNWRPGNDITDGRNNRKHNGIWLQHGWLGDDPWFIRNKKEKKISYFRNKDEIEKLATLLRSHDITDVFPHLCPTSVNGYIPDVDEQQTKRFMNEFKGFRVMPWVGGVLGVQAFPAKDEWRRNFTNSISRLFKMHSDFAGIHINIEPCPDDYRHFLTLLDEVRRVLPEGKILSVVAFPPSTVLHPFTDVHWGKEYYRQVAKRSDQIVVMMYDTSIRFDKVYQYIIAKWTREVLEWSMDSNILLGLPVYDDAGVGYHDPKVENLLNALPAIHAGLSSFNGLPINYQGISLYCEWEMNVEKWSIYEDRFQHKK